MEIWKNNKPVKEWEYIGVIEDNLVYIYEECVMLSREDFLKIKKRYLEARHAKEDSSMVHKHTGV